MTYVSIPPKMRLPLEERESFVLFTLKENGLRPDILVGRNEAISSPRYKPHPSSDWGYVHVSSLKDIDDELTGWIKTAYQKTA
jgi:hypothetical protein